MSDEKESLIGRRVRFRADFYTTRIMPPRDWTGTIEDERRSSSEEGVTSYIVLLDEPFRSQEQNPRVDTTEDEMEPFSIALCNSAQPTPSRPCRTQREALCRNFVDRGLRRSAALSTFRVQQTK